MFKIKFTIGDWSKDGHGQSDTFIIGSNKPVEHLQKIHLKCIDELGFDIGDICRDYGESKVSSKILDILNEHKIPYAFSDYDGKICVEDPEDLVELWLNILMFLDKNIDAKIVSESVIPSMHWPGYKDGKHLNVPGYGLYE